MSGRSGKSRRKAERKRWSLREGSPHEELALVDVLAKIIRRVDGMKDEVSGLMKTQLLFGCEKQAAGLQIQLDILLRLIDKSLDEIWENSFTGEGHAGQGASGFGPESTANTIALAMQQGLKSRPDQQLDPVLRTRPTICSVEWRLSVLQKTGST